MIRIALTTMTLTLGAVALAGSLLWQSVLGSFGLALESVETLAGLQQSRQLVERMRARHEVRKKRATQRFVKRSSRRVAGSALAAATIGTAAVVATVATLEANDYCETQRDLAEDADLLYGTRTPFDLDDCLDTARAELGRIVATTTADLADAASASVDRTRAAGTEALAAVSEAIAPIFDAAEDRVKALWNALFERARP